jgi:hypothetical protein
MGSWKAVLVILRMTLPGTRVEYEGHIVIQFEDANPGAPRPGLRLSQVEGVGALRDMALILGIRG